MYDFFRQSQIKLEPLESLVAMCDELYSMIWRICIRSFWSKSGQKYYHRTIYKYIININSFLLITIKVLLEHQAM